MIEFGTVAEVMRFAELIQHAEGAISKHYLGKPGKITATVMAGHELGVGPMASLRAFHVVEGKPCADYSFWVARLKSAGYRLDWLERTGERVTLKLTAPDGSFAVETWDRARAVTAGLWGKPGTWKLYPQAMLSARCVTSVGRSFAAEVMFGCYLLDEVEDVQQLDAVEVRAVPAPAGAAAADRLIASLGDPPDESAALVTSLARECAEIAKDAGMTRDNLYELMAEHQIEPGRLSDKTLDQLRTIHAALGQLGNAPEAEPPAMDEGEA